MGIKIKIPKIKSVLKHATPLGLAGPKAFDFLKQLDPGRPGRQAARAAQDAATAEANTAERIAAEQRALFRENRGILQGEIGRYENMILDEANRYESDVMALAEASPNELADLERSYSETERLLAREERFVNAIDPALMEASSQALKLLRGEQADINKPALELRNKQRAQIVESLRSTYGNGAENSAIGRQTLQDFDMQTNMMAQQNQQSALGQAFGMATTDTLGGLRSSYGQRFGLAGALSQGKTDQRNRLLRAREGVGTQRLNVMGGLQSAGLAALTGTQQAQMNLESKLGDIAIGHAGAPYVGAALNAQSQQAMFSQLLNIGGQAGAAYLTGGLSAAKPQPAAWQGPPAP